MVAVLYIMGVSSIREFAAPLMVGIICGAYSSVCITGSLWLVMKKKLGAGQAPVKAAATAASVKSTGSKTTAKTSAAPSDPAQSKKKNRKRVQERLAAQEAAKNAENSSDENE